MPRTKKVKLTETQVFMATLEPLRRSDGQLDLDAASKVKNHLGKRLWELEAKLPFSFGVAERFFDLHDRKVTDLKSWNKLLNDVAWAELALQPDSEVTFNFV